MVAAILGALMTLTLWVSLAAAQKVEPQRPTAYEWGDDKNPSGFVKSQEPAKDTAYNYTQMALAGVVVLGMAGLIFVVVRRTKREPLA
jgi:hypothetical protein